MDKGLAQDWTEDAQSRLAALGNMVMADNPVTMTSMRSNSGWTLSFTVLEGGSGVVRGHRR